MSLRRQDFFRGGFLRHKSKFFAIFDPDISFVGMAGMLGYGRPLFDDIELIRVESE